MLTTAAISKPPEQAATQVNAAREATPASSNKLEAGSSTRADSASSAQGSSDSAQESSNSAQGSSKYRLVYDKEFSRTFVQVVDRESGEEILRFPPEELVRFINNSIDGPSTGALGLLLDRSV